MMMNESASVIAVHEIKYLDDSIADDFSTSAEDSDHEVVLSGDEGPSSRSSSGSDLDEAVASPRGDVLSSKKRLVTELVRLPMVTLLELCAFLSTLVLGSGAKPLESVQAFSALAQEAVAFQPAQQKASATKAQEKQNDQQGASQQEAPSHAALPLPLRMPPGLSLSGNLLELDAIGLPPGLEAFAGPPASPTRHVPSWQGSRGLSRQSSQCHPPGVLLPAKQLPAQRKPKNRVSAQGTRVSQALLSRCTQQAPNSQVQAEAPDGILKLPVRKPSLPVCVGPLASSEPSSPPVSNEAVSAAQLPLAPLPPLEPCEFDQAVYRKELSNVLRDLANGHTVSASVRRIRAQSVPLEKQAGEFSDILTRAAEEHRGAARRLSFAFAAGLANGAFEREECMAGLQYFFLEVFEDLAEEVPRLRNKLANELTPTLRTVFSSDELSRLIPPDCRCVLG